ncbi:MAG: 2-oxoacid:acceptor oxidoreductase subunit alpha [Thermoplasmata archaeon]|nr:MAG: 2-oxoacid:acceptor oxidoreductase subunit alpha [Thermoplasmata archaeon]
MSAEEYNKVTKALGKQKQFIQGDTAVAYGAVLAGCRFFAGYPITPATETAEIFARIMPKIGGACIQMEDEIASIGAVIGAAWAGAKAMTTTSGPGFSLMQENIGYACMTETPCVIVNVQRSGPSTGQPTEAAQGDVMQARWGTHGDHEIIALSPNSPQESLDLMITAFNLAEKYRNPVIILTDGDVGHMREEVVIPKRKDLRLTERKTPSKDKEKYKPFKAGKDKIPEMANFGTGYHTYVTGLTHKENGLPSTDDKNIHHALIKRLSEKIADDRDKIVMVEKRYQKGSKVSLVSYGISARSSMRAVKMLRKDGIKTDFLRLITIWPFPIKEIQAMAKKVDSIFVPEMNLGQINHPIAEFCRGECDVVSIPKTGGEMHSPSEIVDSVKGGV